MESKGLMGGFYKISEWIMRIAGSNLLWVLCSSPFLFFLITKLLFLQNPDLPPENLTILAMAVLTPFVLFPATSALFSVTRKWVMGQTDLGVFKVYFKSYKENYKQSMIGGIFYTILVVVMVFDYTVYMNQFQNLQIIGIIVIFFLALLLLSMFNFFSLLSHYQLKTTQLLKNAVMFTIISPLRTLLTLVVAIAVGYFTLRYGWLFFVGTASLIAFVAFYNFYIAFNKVQAKAERLTQAEEELKDENEIRLDVPEKEKN